MQEILYAGLIGAIVALMYGLIALPFKFLKKKMDEKAEEEPEDEEEIYYVDDEDDE